MTNEDDDGFMAQLAARFNSYGTSPAKVEARAQRERAAGMTTAQRARRGPPTRQLNIRATERTRGLIERLGDKLGQSQTQIIADAIELLARKEDIGP